MARHAGEQMFESCLIRAAFWGRTGIEHLFGNEGDGYERSAGRRHDRPAADAYGRKAAPLRLTDRGIAVVVVFFLALLATAAVVLVTSFLSISNDPIPANGVQPALVALQG
jgi:hypothetical protein